MEEKQAAKGAAGPGAKAKAKGKPKATAGPPVAAEEKAEKEEAPSTPSVPSSTIPSGSETEGYNYDIPPENAGKPSQMKIAGFFAQTGLLFMKNLKVKIRGDIFTFIAEIVFPLMYLGLLILIYLYQRPTNFPAQKTPDTRYTNILRGFFASAFENPLTIGFVDVGTAGSSIPESDLLAAWKLFTGSRDSIGTINKPSLIGISPGFSLDLKFMTSTSITELEEARSNGSLSLEAAVVVNYTEPFFEYTIYAQSGSFFAPPSTSAEIYENLDTCRQNYQIDKNKVHPPELPNSCPVNGYFYSGFLALQFIVHQAILKQYVSNSTYEKLFLKDVKFRNYPKVAYEGEMSKLLRSVIPVLSLLPMAQLVSGLLVLIVTEKESRIKEGLRMVGVKGGPYWLSWFLLYAIYTSLFSIIFTIVIGVVIMESRVNIVLLFLLFFLFGLSVITFAFALTPFFHKPKTAGLVGLLIMQLFGFLFLAQTFLDRGTDIDTFLYVFRIISSVAFTSAIDDICNHLHLGGVGFGDAKPGGRADRVFYSLLFLAIDTIVYALLAFYLDNVIPNEMGARSHPLFCCMSLSQNEKKAKNVDTEDTVSDPNIEKVPSFLRGTEAIRMRNVTKTFTKMFSSKKVHAIKGVSLDIYENQITAILGRNGAGKSTLFSILIGLLPPTKGTTTVFGLNTSVPSDMDKLRQMTGACLQYDVHFGPLTVKEHLMFYAQLRGLKGAALNSEVTSILNDLKLSDKADARAGSLSGGQKRKLSVGAALIGDPRIILLDEPSAGVDPVSRRQLWALLKRKKEGRVILLTTHFLDEADFLADRKAIINNGELKCHGSSLFLKNRFGVGYHVNIATEESYDESLTDGVIKKYIPNALETKRLIGGREIKYSLPNSEVHSFPALFADLEALISKHRDFKSFGVSMTTLEEVFLLISNDEVDVPSGGDADRKTKVQFGASQDEDFELKKKRRSSVTGEEFNLINDSAEIDADYFGSLGALSLLRIRRIIRNPQSLIFMLLIPILLTVISLLFMQGRDVTDTIRTLNFSVPGAIYPKDSLRLAVAPSTGDWNSNSKIQDSLSKGKVLSQVDYSGIYSSLLDSPKPTVAALEFGDESFDISFNGSYLHGPPIVLTALAQFQSSLYPKADEKDNLIIKASFKPFLSQTSFMDQYAMLSVGLIAPSFIFPAVGMVLELVKDRQMDVRNNLRVNGISFTLYILPVFIVYGLLSLIVIGLQLGILHIFKIIAFTNGYAFTVVALLLILYVIPCLLFSATLSYLFDTVESAQSIFVPVSFLLGIVFGLVMVVVEGKFGRLFDRSPPTPVLATHAMFSFFNVYYIPFGTFFWVGRQFTVCKLRYDADRCAEQIIKFEDYFGVEIWIILVCLCIQIPLFYGLLLLADIAKSEGNLMKTIILMMRKKSKVRPANKSSKRKSMAAEGGDGTAEEDVLNEGARVQRLWNGDEEDDLSVVLVKNLRKTYYKRGGLLTCYRRKRGGVKALKELNLVVDEGEVFGLLGHNGAGKTTAMKIIIAEEQPDYGAVKLFDTEIESSYSRAFQHLGYCAQHDPLWEGITLREHMEMYSKIRGVSEEKQPGLITRFLAGLQIEEHADSYVEKLSGGTKRKLCYAISMLGHPKAVLLDEPSTGLDPQSKRFLWNTILGSFKVNRGAILTTHSIEEAEVLCSRIGILSKGSLICIGSPQHLKSKYGTGYTLEVKLKKVRGEISEEKFSFIQKTFPDSEITEIFDDRAVFSLTTASVQSISKTFALLEKLKAQYNMEDYSFSQTTLEQIFLLFSKEEEDEEGDEMGASKILEEHKAKRKSKAKMDNIESTASVDPSANV